MIEFKEVLDIVEVLPHEKDAGQTVIVLLTCNKTRTTFTLRMTKPVVERLYHRTFPERNKS